MVKFRLFLFVFTVICVSSQAQLDKNSWLLGGSGRISLTSQTATVATTYRDFNVSIKPNVGYFLFDRFAAGALIGFSYDRLKTNYYVNSGTEYALGTFARYYLLKKEKQVNLLAQGSYLHRIGVLANVSSQISSDVFTLTTGPVIFLNSVVGLEITGNYELTKPSNNQNINKISNLFLSIGLQIHLEKDN